MKFCMHKQCGRTMKKKVATQSLRIFLLCDETKELSDIDNRKVFKETMLTGKK